MTLSEFTEAFESKLVTSWDHTAHLLSMLYNQIISQSAKGGKAKPASHFHPFKEKQLENRITKKNFKVLKQIGDALVQAKRKP